MPASRGNTSVHPDNNNSTNETSPLLQHGTSSSRNNNTTTTKPGQSSSSSTPTPWLPNIPSIPIPIPIPSIKPTTLVPLLGLLTVFLNESEYFIRAPAQFRAMEAMACLEYFSTPTSPGYDKHLARLGKNIPELRCKQVPAIQERVAALVGTLWIVRQSCCFVGTFLILQWFKAKRRRPVLVLHKLNLMVSNLWTIVAYFGYPRLPIWFITLNGVSGLMGGNFDLGASTLFAAYADIISDQAHRSNLIFVTMSLQYAAQAVCLPLTGRLMSMNGNGTTPEISFYVSATFSVLAFALNAFLFPETFQPEHEQLSGSEDINADADDDLDSSRRPLLDEQHRNASGNKATESTKNTEKLSDSPFYVLRTEFGLLRVIFLLLAMFCSAAGTRIIDWYGIYQYPGIKFNWTLSKTTYLICMQAILSFFNFAVTFPLVNRICQRKFKLSAQSTSLGIVVASAVVLGISAIVYGLPGTTATIFIVMAGIYTFGAGVTSGLQAWTVNAAPSTRASGAALSVTSLASMAGKIASSIIWPTALSTGLEHKSGKLAGLPFFIVAGILAFLIVFMCLAERAGKRGRKLSVASSTSS